jgi:hypothetical protein
MLGAHTWSDHDPTYTWSKYTLEELQHARGARRMLGTALNRPGPAWAATATA